MPLCFWEVKGHSCVRWWLSGILGLLVFLAIPVTVTSFSSWMKTSVRLVGICPRFDWISKRSEKQENREDQPILFPQFFTPHWLLLHFPRSCMCLKWSKYLTQPSPTLWRSLLSDGLLDVTPRRLYVMREFDRCSPVHDGVFLCRDVSVERLVGRRGTSG